MVLSTRRLPFLVRVLVSPVPRCHRYYEGATTSHPRICGRLLVRFHSPHDPPSFVLALALPEDRRSLPGPGFGWPAARLSGFLRVDANGISQVFRRSFPCLCSVPRPRSNRRALAMTVTSMPPPLCAQRRLRAMLDFGANPQLQHTLTYASCFALPLARKARFRLAGWPLPNGSRTHWIATRGFSSC